MQDNHASINQNADQIIFDVTTAEFEQRVINASMERPVLVDFWAPWCGPCKQLMPVLEAVVSAAGGAVSLAKVNLDENPQLAQALQVKSVPTVFGFFQGRAIDAFQGVIPESQIKGFIAKLLEAARQAQPDALDIPEALKTGAQAIATGDLNAAQAIYSQILSQDQNNAAAYVGLVRVYLAAGQLEQAAQLIENAPEDISASPSFAEAKTALALAQNAEKFDVDALNAAVQKKPKDHAARIELAQGLFATGHKQDAVEHLLHSIQMDKSWNEQQARKTLLEFFEALGHADPLTIEARKKLSSILFS